MGKVRVPIYRTTPTQIALIDPAATVGATVGTNLYHADGTLVQESELGNAGDVTLSLSDFSTDDLQEGKFSLYFTGRRAQDAVGGILADSANVTLTYVVGTSITADLTDLADTGAGSLLAITVDAKGRVTGTRAATITGTTGEIDVADGDASAGPPTISLADVSVSAGGTLKKRAFDAKGRLSQEAAATTDDLTEGATNQWFTMARVRSAVLTGLSLATSAVIAATDTVLQAFGKLQAQITDNLLPKGYIDGLQMQWVSGTALTVTSGAAYIEGSSKVLRATSAIAKTGLSLSASTWYHVYLYDNAGTPDFELSTTAPASPYNGTARSKTGDTSRRYVGSIVTDATGVLYKFKMSLGEIFYLEKISPRRVVSAGVSTTPASFSLASLAPVTASFVTLSQLNTDSVTAVIDSSDMNYTPGTARWIEASGGSKFTFPIPLPSSRNLSYYYLSAPSLGAIYIDLISYRYDR